MKQSNVLKKSLFKRGPGLNYKRILIVSYLFCCMTTFLFGLNRDSYEQELYNASIDPYSGVYYSIKMPNFIFRIDTDLKLVRIMHSPGTESNLLQITPMAYTRVTRDQGKLLNNIGFWNNMTIGSVGLNCLILGLVMIDNSPDSGGLSVLSHLWFGVCNSILAGAYEDLNFSVSIYGPKGKNPTPGLWFASGAAFFAIIGSGLGMTMLGSDGHPGVPMIIASSVCAGLSNVLGISSYIYYLIYKNSFTPLTGIQPE